MEKRPPQLDEKRDQAPRLGGLELDTDVPFARRQYRVQQAGWLLMAAILIAWLLGAFGDGPLADAEVGSADDPLSVSYHRIDRKHRPTALAIHLSGDATADGETEVWMSKSFLSRIRIDDIAPEPSEMHAAADGVVLVIQTEQPGQPANVTIAFEYNGFGRLHAEIGLVDGSRRPLSIVVMP